MHDQADTRRWMEGCRAVEEHARIAAVGRRTSSTRWCWQKIGQLQMVLAEGRVSPGHVAQGSAPQNIRRKSANEGSKGAGLALGLTASRAAHLVVLHAVLDVDEADDFEILGQLGRPLPDGGQALLRHRLRRDDARRVARVHARLRAQRPNSVQRSLNLQA